MQVQRFFLPPDSIDSRLDFVTIAERSTFWQITQVLRLRAGDRIDILDGRGMLYSCQLEEVTQKQVRARILDRQAAGGEPNLEIAVALPLLRGGRFEWALQKLTELGVRSVIPFFAKHNVVKAEGKKGADKDRGEKAGRWATVMREAAEQCERGLVPSLSATTSFNQLISEAARNYDISLICAERRQSVLLSSLARQMSGSQAPCRTIAVIVGPEGGFAQEEIDIAIECGIKPVSLGPRILRSETAAIFAVSQIISTIGDT